MPVKYHPSSLFLPPPQKNHFPNYFAKLKKTIFPSSPIFEIIVFRELFPVNRTKKKKPTAVPRFAVSTTKKGWEKFFQIEISSANCICRPVNRGCGGRGKRKIRRIVLNDEESQAKWLDGPTPPPLWSIRFDRIASPPSSLSCLPTNDSPNFSPKWFSRHDPIISSLLLEKKKKINRGRLFALFPIPFSNLDRNRCGFEVKNLRGEREDDSFALWNSFELKDWKKKEENS